MTFKLQSLTRLHTSISAIMPMIFNTFFRS